MQGGLSSGGPTAYEAAITSAPTGSTQQGQQSNGQPANAIAGAAEASQFSRDDLILGFMALNALAVTALLLMEVSG
jgi:hypothetical protein